MMKKKAIGIAALVLAASGIGGVALTSQASAAPSAPQTTASPSANSETKSGPDSDALQQGDQSTPDRTGASTTAEKAGTEQANESSAASDGPGGHQDPAGNVQHQGGANEQ